jgi:hypothetical protein
VGLETTLTRRFGVLFEAGALPLVIVNVAHVGVSGRLWLTEGPGGGGLHVTTGPDFVAVASLWEVLFGGDLAGRPGDTDVRFGFGFPGWAATVGGQWRSSEGGITIDGRVGAVVSAGLLQSPDFFWWPRPTGTLTVGLTSRRKTGP